MITIHARATPMETPDGRRLRLQASATIRACMPGPTTTIATEPITHLPAGDAELLERLTADALKRIEEELTAAGYRRADIAEAMHVYRSAAARTRDAQAATRAELLAAAGEHASPAFDLIDHAAAAEGVEWACSSGLGIRGGLDRRPVIERATGIDEAGRTFVGRNRWQDHGAEYACVLAIAERAASGRTDVAGLHADPLAMARGLYLETLPAVERHGTPEEERGRFTLASAPWWALVIAGDDASVDEWRHEFFNELAESDVRRLHDIHDAIHAWMHAAIQPGEADYSRRWTT